MTDPAMYELYAFISSFEACLVMIVIFIIGIAAVIILSIASEETTIVNPKEKEADPEIEALKKAAEDSFRLNYMAMEAEHQMQEKARQYAGSPHHKAKPSKTKNHDYEADYDVDYEIVEEE